MFEPDDLTVPSHLAGKTDTARHGRPHWAAIGSGKIDSVMDRREDLPSPVAQTERRTDRPICWPTGYGATSQDESHDHDQSMRGTQVAPR